MVQAAGRQKTGGRKKGTPNKKTLELQGALASHGVDVVAQLAAILPQLEIERRAGILINMLPYLYPKRKHIQHTVEPPVDPISLMTDEEIKAEIKRLYDIRTDAENEDAS